MKVFLSLCGALLLVASPVARGYAATAPVSGYKVVATFPHSTSSYTEGFFYLDGLFYEGTGVNGHSEVLVYRPGATQPLRSFAIPSQYFGEGIVNWGPLLYEWTWQSHVGFIYDRATLRPIGRFSYSGEGWGMTQNGKEIITSDGTATLRFRDPRTFRETRHILVTDDGHPINELNELEWVKGEIYANVWHTNRIARISPETGKVLGWIDLSNILSVMLRPNNPEAVLNGIAYDAQHDRLFVTGKDWPLIFQIKVQ